MRGDIKLIRGLGVSAVALLLLVGGVTAASSGGTQSRVEATATSEATATAGTENVWRRISHRSDCSGCSASGSKVLGRSLQRSPNWSARGASGLDDLNR